MRKKKEKRHWESPRPPAHSITTTAQPCTFECLSIDRHSSVYRWKARKPPRAVSWVLQGLSEKGQPGSREVPWRGPDQVASIGRGRGRQK